MPVCVIYKCPHTISCHNYSSWKKLLLLNQIYFALRFRYYMVKSYIVWNLHTPHNSVDCSIKVAIWLAALLECFLLGFLKGQGAVFILEGESGI